MQKLNSTFDGVLHRVKADLGAGPLALAVAVLATSQLPHVQVGTKDATVRVAYSTRSREDIEAAITTAEAEVAAAAGTPGDVFSILTAGGEPFIEWSLGEVPAQVNRSDYFEAAVSAVLFYCHTVDSTAVATIVQ